MTKRKNPDKAYVKGHEYITRYEVGKNLFKDSSDPVGGMVKHAKDCKKCHPQGQPQQPVNSLAEAVEKAMCKNCPMAKDIEEYRAMKQQLSDFLEEMKTTTKEFIRVQKIYTALLMDRKCPE